MKNATIGVLRRGDQCLNVPVNGCVNNVPWGFGTYLPYQGVGVKDFWSDGRGWLCCITVAGSVTANALSVAASCMV